MLERKPDSRFPTLTERFVKYAKIHTTSVEGSETYPSHERQFDLARVLVEELKDLGLKDAAVDDNCYVTATLPANFPGGLCGVWEFCAGTPAASSPLRFDHAGIEAPRDGPSNEAFQDGGSTPSSCWPRLTGRRGSPGAPREDSPD